MYLSVYNGSGYGYEKLLLTVNTADNSAFVGQSVPTEMVVGTTYPVSVTLRNAGVTTWRPGTYQLGYVAPTSGRPSCWGTSQVTLPNSVAPQQSMTVSFSVTAPTAPGHYEFCWQMNTPASAGSGGVESFGDCSPDYPIDVVS